MVCTKVFTSGNSQAVRIPKEFHIDFSELFIKKIGSSIILTPKESKWENLKRSLSGKRLWRHGNYEYGNL